MKWGIKQIHHLLVTGLLVSVSIAGLAQSNPYMDYATWENFFSSGIADQTLDPWNCDTHLLNAAVFFQVNRFRHKKKREALLPHSDFQELTHDLRRNNSRSRFKHRGRLDRKVHRKMDRELKPRGVKARVYKTITEYPVLVAYVGRSKSFHFDDEREGSEFNLFYGSRPSPKDSLYVPKPIAAFTYESFAIWLVQNWSRGRDGKLLRAKGFRFASVSIGLDVGTLNRKRLPQGKALLLLAGYRLNWDTDRLEVSSP